MEKVRPLTKLHGIDINSDYIKHKLCFIGWSVPTHAQPIEPEPDITSSEHTA